MALNRTQKAQLALLKEHGIQQNARHRAKQAADDDDDDMIHTQEDLPELYILLTLLSTAYETCEMIRDEHRENGCRGCTLCHDCYGISYNLWTHQNTISSTLPVPFMEAADVDGQSIRADLLRSFPVAAEPDGKAAPAPVAAAV